MMESMHLFVLIYRVEIMRRESSLMDTELTLFKRGIRIIDSLRPLQRQTFDSMELFSRVADSCYFDEDGILRLEIKEHRVNEAFLQFVDGKDEDVSDSEEEEEQGSNDLNGDGEDYSDPVSPYMRQYEDSHSFVVSLL